MNYNPDVSLGLSLSPCDTLRVVWTLQRASQKDSSAIKEVLNFFSQLSSVQTCTSLSPNLVLPQ